MLVVEPRISLLYSLRLRGATFGRGFDPSQASLEWATCLSLEEVLRTRWLGNGGGEEDVLRPSRGVAVLADDGSDLRPVADGMDEDVEAELAVGA